MKNFCLFISLLLLTILFTGCQNTLPPVEYVEWIQSEKNGLHKTGELDDFSFALQYEPATYKALKEYKTKGSQDEFSALKSSYEGLLHFVLQVHPNKNMTGKKSKRLVHYFDHEMENDLKLVVEKDTLRAAMMHLERPLQIRPYYNLLIAFENDPQLPEKDWKLIYEGDYLGSRFAFRIRKGDLKKLPKLVLGESE